MAFLEKNMIWLNTVITVAPMIGFTGTVVGMIAAFDAIKAANDISPAVVAGGQAEGIAMSKCASAEPQAHAHQRKHMQAQTNAGRQPQASPAAEDVQ